MTGYARDSRYRALSPTARNDAAGRTLLSTPLRRRPATGGKFQHTLEAGERLDNLGQRYYRKPRKWWRICDANPEFDSPLALIGADPLETARLIVTPGAAHPPWPILLAALRAVVGVDDVAFALESRVLSGASIETGAVTVVYNRLNTSALDLVALAELAGFPTLPPEMVGRVGKPITVPPDGIGEGRNNAG